MSWFNFFKKGITVRDTETWGKILLKYKSVIPEYYFDKGEDIILGIRSSLFIPQAEIEKWGRLRNECDELNKSIDKTAQLNNQGIANEEQKEFDKAIEFYEENLNVGGIATHSYDRLMILYRKRKQYSDELRVIDLALNRFSKENEKRYSQAVANPANRKYLEQIESAMEVNSGVKNNEGWFIFNPYYIIHWIERREKVLKLIEKAKRNGNLGGAINH